jgi:hypothetical protein
VRGPPPRRELGPPVDRLHALALHLWPTEAEDGRWGLCELIEQTAGDLDEEKRDALAALPLAVEEAHPEVTEEFRESVGTRALAIAVGDDTQRVRDLIEAIPTPQRTQLLDEGVRRFLGAAPLSTQILLREFT